MADSQFNPLGSVAAPADWTIPPSLNLQLKNVYASFDGSAATSSFVPCLQIISDSGHTVGSYPCATSVAAGGSADVTWFPAVAGTPITTTSIAFVGARIYSVAIETASTSTNTDFTYDTVDTDSAHMANLGADNRILTATFAGFYQVSAQVTWSPNGTGRRLILIKKNGYYAAGTGTIVASASWTAIVGASLSTPTSVSTLVYLAEGDFVSVGVNQNSGGNLSTSAGTLNQPYQNYLAAVLVGS